MRKLIAVKPKPEMFDDSVLVLDRYKPKDKLILSERKLEYLSLAALGFRNFQIANILNVSESTVKKTFEEVFKILNAKDRTNAVTIGFIYGILDVFVLNCIIKRYCLQNQFN